MGEKHGEQLCRGNDVLFRSQTFSLLLNTHSSVISVYTFQILLKILKHYALNYPTKVSQFHPKQAPTRRDPGRILREKTENQKKPGSDAVSDQEKLGCGPFLRCQTRSLEISCHYQPTVDCGVEQRLEKNL